MESTICCFLCLTKVSLKESFLNSTSLLYHVIFCNKRVFFLIDIHYDRGMNLINIKEEYMMNEKLKDKKVQLGVTIATVIAGVVSGLVVKKVKDKRK